MSNTNIKLKTYIKFYKIEVEIISQLLSEIGVFEKFCFKSILFKLSVEDISDITQLRRDIVQERIDFLVKHNYLIEKLGFYEFTDLGNNVVKHMALVDHYKNNQINLAVDNFLLNNKDVYLFDSISKNLLGSLPTDKDFVFPENMSKYKIEFEGVLEDKIKDKVKRIISNKFEHLDLEKLIIDYEISSEYFLPLDITLDDLKFENVKDPNFLIPCLEKKVLVSFPELVGSSSDERNFLLLLADKSGESTENKNIIEVLKKNYLIESFNEGYKITSTGEIFVNLIKWSSKYKNKPIRSAIDLIWGIENINLNSLINSSDKKKVVRKKINNENLEKDFSDEINKNGSDILKEWVKNIDLEYPEKTLLQMEIKPVFNEKYLPARISENLVRSKINNAVNHVCDSCNGTRKIACNYCNSTGLSKPRKNCERCERGNYKVSCKKCTGTGKYKDSCSCPKCYGSGNFRVTCKKCSGSGYVYAGSCFSCRGIGYKYLECKPCNGSGYWAAIYCSSCNGDGLINFDCRSCEGKGYFPEIICNKCLKSGFIDCPDCSYVENNKSVELDSNNMQIKWKDINSPLSKQFSGGA